MTLSELLAQYDLTEDDLSVSLERRLSVRPVPGAVDLTGAEETFWSRHAGIRLRTTDASVLDRATEETETLLEAASRSLTIEDAATLLGIHRSRVSHRLREGSLYAFRIGSQRRLPRWQFGPHGTPLPGLEQVLPVLPADLHPASVEGFFTTADPDLGGVTPAGWLSSGGDPRRVVDQATALELW